MKRQETLEWERDRPYQHPFHLAFVLAVLVLADLVTTLVGIKQGIPEGWPPMASMSLTVIALQKGLEIALIILAGVWFTTAPVRVRRWVYRVFGVLCIVQAAAVLWNLCQIAKGALS